MGQFHAKSEPSDAIGLSIAHAISNPISAKEGFVRSSFTSVFSYGVVAAAVGVTLAWIAALVYVVVSVVG